MKIELYRDGRVPKLRAVYVDVRGKVEIRHGGLVVPMNF